MSSEMQRDSEQELERLFAHARPRQAPPPADEAFIRAAVESEWDALMGRRARARRFAAFAAAAAVAALAIGVGTTLYEMPEAPLLATVERAQGAVEITAEGGAPVQASVGTPITAGMLVATGSGQAALRLSGRGSLRLAAGTRVRLLDAREAELVAGLAYYDSEGGTSALTVQTPHGTVRDVGTQFFTRVLEDRLEVGVRDGSVAIARDAFTAEVASGEKLIVPEGGAARREPLPTFGAEWAWVEPLAPPFAIDGRRVAELLVWVAEQTGHELAYADADVERLAATTVMRGSIDLDPLAKLAAVLATTDLEHSIDDGTILIRTR